MRRSLAIVALLLSLLLPGALPLSAQSLTLDEILARHTAARGGAEAWGRVQSLTLTGQYTAFSEVGPFTLHRQRPGRLYFDHQMGQHRVVEGYDGEHAWWKNPLYGIDWAIAMPAPDAALMPVESHLVNPLFEARERGHRVEWVGEEDFDGEDTYHLKVTLASGGEEDWYLSRDTFLEFARAYTASDFGRPLPGRRYFMDFQKVGDLVLPFRIEDEFGTRHRVMEVDSVTVNPDLSAVDFGMPIPEGMDRLASLVGEWQVTISLIPYPGAPPLEIPGTSTIQGRFDGGLLEEELTFDLQGSTSLSRRTLSYDRFAGVYRLLTYDNLSYHPNLSEGSFEPVEEGEETGGGEILTLTSQTPWQQNGQPQLERRKLSGISADGFQVVEEVSIDGGETWQPGLTLVYQRKV